MLVRNKIWFHAAVGGNLTGWGSAWRQLDAAGIPVFAISADNAGPLYEIQEGASVPEINTLVWRPTTLGQGDGFNYDTPDYLTDPLNTARIHHGRQTAVFPPELDPTLVWKKVNNEIRTKLGPDDQMWAGLHPGEWWGLFAREYANMSLAAGERVCFFNIASGDHTREFWTQPAMIDFLRLAAVNPDRIAVGLHEYSYVVDNILDPFPSIEAWAQAAPESGKIGRFRLLFDVCDEYGIDEWPTVFLPEWGWTQDNVPGEAQAVADVALVTEHIYGPYAGYVWGGGIWYLGPGYAGIADKAQKLIQPITDLMLNEQFDVEEKRPSTGPPPIDPPPDDCVMPNCGRPRVQYGRRYWVVPASLPEPRRVELYTQAAKENITTGPSYDDAGLGDLADKTAVLWDIPESERQPFLDWFAEHYPGTAVEFQPENPQPPGEFTAVSWPVEALAINQWFGENPQNYEQFGLPGHEGLDLRAPTGSPIFAVADGRVIRAEGNPNVSAYGVHVRLEHQDGEWRTIYAHMERFTVAVDQIVRAGDVIVYADNTGNSFGSHLHFGVKHIGFTYTDPNGVAWPYNFVDPWTILRPLYDEELGRGTTGYLWAASLIVEQSGGYGRATGTLNLREQASSGSTLLGQVTVGTVSHITGPVENGYFPVLTLPVDAPDITPPPTGVARVGLHASADDYAVGGDAEFAEFVTLQPGIIKVQSFHNPQMVGRLVEENKATCDKWIVRAYLSWGGRMVTAQNFYDWTIGDLIRTIDVILGHGVSMDDILIEIHNEPNLEPEGWTYSWQDGVGFAEFWLAVRDRYAAALPNGRFMYPGLSPGGGVFGLRFESNLFLEQSAAAVAAADVIGCHAYWSDGFPIGSALGQVDDVIARAGGKPVYVTEASRNDGAKDPATMGHEYYQFWQDLKRRVTVQGVTYYVASASNPQYDHEVWVRDGRSLGIAAALRELT